MSIYSKSNYMTLMIVFISDKHL